jgi:SAM-dependent methyltransferase
MEPGGMVHALEEIHRILRPSGTLIEIHPIHGAWIEVRTDDAVLFVQPDPGFDSDDELRPTEAAIRNILERGVFTLDAERGFDFLAYASSARELRGFFALVGAYDQSPDSPTITRLRDELYGRAQDVLDRSENDARIVYREQARMSRLVPS